MTGVCPQATAQRVLSPSMALGAGHRAPVDLFEVERVLDRYAPQLSTP